MSTGSRARKIRAAAVTLNMAVRVEHGSGLPSEALNPFGVSVLLRADATEDTILRSESSRRSGSDEMSFCKGMTGASLEIGFEMLGLFEGFECCIELEFPR